MSESKLKEFHKALLMKSVGWTFAYCCQLLDDGKDPREIEIPEVIEKAYDELIRNGD